MNTYFKISLQMYKAFLLEVVHWIDLNKEYNGNETFLIATHE